MCCRILFTLLIISLDVFVSYKLWDEPPWVEYYFGRMIATIGLQFFTFTVLMIGCLIEGRYFGKAGNSCMNSETGMCLTLIFGGKTGNEKVRQMDLKYHPRPGILEPEVPESDFGDIDIPESQNLGPKIYPKIEVKNEKAKTRKPKSKLRGFFFSKPKFFRF